MTLYVLTHCAAEENYTPRVFKTLEEARKALKKTYEDLVFNEEANTNEWVESFEVCDDSVEIVYVDDSYDRLDIFKVEEE